ncbi:hypothetical protein U1701_09485 [Sphingomonas sp. PB2P19]|uniref:hypothetical protein n=1 Tax=Sphingomonas rhamnosi TaxID=3096156 RepID=UPI002FCBB578
MLLALILVAGAAAEEPAQPALQAWGDCLLMHAQVATAGTARDTAIALAGLTICGAERDRYAKALVRAYAQSPAETASPASRSASQVREDQAALARRTLAFIRRVRER